MTRGRRFSKENFPNILKLVGGIQEIAKRHGATAGQVSLAWLLAQGDDIIPIPGTGKLKVKTSLNLLSDDIVTVKKNLEENIGAMSLTLTPEEVQEVRDIAAAADTSQGDRYPAFFQGQGIEYADTPELK
jgi:aryl-alcohol dehydrogenase-like predicted oxidoreductase